MKKFCSTCGNQLELSQRFCSKCGTVNPFFVSSFSFLSDQSEELEKLRLEKERIDKELAEKEEKQAEFKRQEQLRREAEEAERLRLELKEKEKQEKEQRERERIEQNLKFELQKIKEETQQYKQETVELVKEVKQELLQLEEDNKRLKEKVAGLDKGVSLAGKTEVALPEAKSSDAKSSPQKRVTVSLFVSLLALASVLLFYFFMTSRNTEIVETPAIVPQEVSIQSKEMDTVSDEINIAEHAVDTVQTEIEAVPKVPAPVVAEATTPVKTESVSEKPKETFALTEAKIRRDLVNKKISGCDIIIGSSSEIEVVRNITLVEKLPSGQMKYKFAATIVQEGESYSATPYVYYNTAGNFIKIDGTNCE